MNAEPPPVNPLLQSQNSASGSSHKNRKADTSLNTSLHRYQNRQRKRGGEKSYIKSRRSQHRSEKRKDILGYLDRNLDGSSSQTMDASLGSLRSNQSHPVPQSPHSTTSGKHSVYSPHSHNSQSFSSVGTPNSTSNPLKNATSPKPRKLRSFIPFLRTDGDSVASSITNGKKKKNKKGQQTTEATKQPHLSQEEKQIQDLIIQVLESYPKGLCSSFADHQQFAMAELTTHSKDLYLSRVTLDRIKKILVQKLEERLLGISEETPEEGPSHSPSSQLTPAPRENHRKSDPAPRGRSPSPIKPRSSSRSLAAPMPRPKSNPKLSPHEGDNADNTSSTADDDEESLAVEHLLVKCLGSKWGKYTGPICASTGKPHGKLGKILYKCKDHPKKVGCFQGDWNQGKWCGQGRHLYPNGDKYQGAFLDDLPHGVGTFKYSDGNRTFHGRYVLGERVEGRMVYGDGSIYKGQWYKNKRHGRGTYLFSDESKYKGEFEMDKLHGVGQLVWPDGSKYVGEWSNGQRHGMGKEYKADGELRFSGMWKENEPIKQQ